MNFNNSKQIYDEAKKIIPGGVNSPVRAFKSVNREFPIFVKSGAGSKVTDEDGNEYIDYICSWGPLIFGHNYEPILKGVRETIELGSSFGLPTKNEIKLAELVRECYPTMEMVRLTSSGTEATMAAIRVARAYTSRNKILKFNGCYHGHSDSLLVSSGSGLLTAGCQDSNGITSGVLQDTLVAEFGDRESVEKFLMTKEVACIILEPIPANMGLICTEKNYLEFLRKLCDETGTLLIFDEVISGFRVALGGAAELYNVKPDIITLGKIIGGGYPVGAFGGKKEIMNLIAPVGRVYHAGTLSGNPVSVRAGIETILELQRTRETLYKDLETKVNFLVENIKHLATKYNVPVCVNKLGSLFTIFFTNEPQVTNLKEAMTSNTNNYSIYFNTMLENNIVVAPSQYEVHFVSAAHTQKDLDKTLDVIEIAFKKIGSLK